ncbi:dTDP-4-amino-4,6-dideoxygalactose transaminase [Candidatus Cloacimonadota bacterium]
MIIPFNKPLILGNEQQHIARVIDSGKISAKGNYNQKCSQLMDNIFSCRKTFLTSNCTSALEMVTLLIDLKPEDEVIMPSFTHVGTANPFLRTSAEIRWCDIREDTKNIDEKKIEELISVNAKAVVVVHYGGVSCQIEEIVEICRKHDLILIEDCAMAIGSTWKNKPVGSFGDLAVVSFHDTKNIHCGEGGALLINNPEMLEKAEILINCGTNRTQFEQSKTDHYSWVAKSSNFQMSELQAAFLYPQLLEFKQINKNRLATWDLFYTLLSEFWEIDQLPFVPKQCSHNAHLFYLILKTESHRKKLITHLSKAGISSVFHYIPLHSAPIWKDNCKSLPVTEKVASTILRLPMYYGFSKDEVKYIVQMIREFCDEEN